MRCLTISLKQFFCCKRRELLGSISNDVFWATNVNRKWAFFSFNVPWCYHNWIAKSFYSDRDDLLENLFKIMAQSCNKSTSGWRASLKHVVSYLTHLCSHSNGDLFTCEDIMFFAWKLTCYFIAVYIIICISCLPCFKTHNILLALNIVIWDSLSRFHKRDWYLANQWKAIFALLIGFPLNLTTRLVTLSLFLV